MNIYRILFFSALYVALTSPSICEDIGEQITLRGIEQITSQATAGDAKSQAALGYGYYFGKGVPLDYVEAAKWFKKAATQGNAEAAFYLGGIYGFGFGVPKDLEAAFRWYLIAAEKGDVSAQTLIGQLYAEGKGTPQNLEAALQWLLKASNAGDPVAMERYARWCLRSGKKETWPEATKWLINAAWSSPSARRS